jgi:hypothetical protein
MIEWLLNKKINFSMRIPSNRIVSSEKAVEQLSKHPELKLKGNAKYKTIYASYKGNFCYFTVQKRK